MKKGLCRFYKTMAFALLLVIGLSGCTKEYYTQEGDIIYDGAQMENEYFNVTKDMWEWDDENERYECVFDFPLLTDKIYGTGAIAAAVFVNPEEANESLEVLPFAYTFLYQDVNGDYMAYTQNMSCTFQPGKAYFYMQASDREHDDDKLQGYQFKVTMFWKN